MKKCTNQGKFNGKLCALDIQIVRFIEKFDIIGSKKSWKFNEKVCTLEVQVEFVESIKLWKSNEKLCTLDVQIVQDLLKNLNSLNLQNLENSMENQRWYQTGKVYWKIT